MLDLDSQLRSPPSSTHHLTLYRHQSGALVFGAGTVQWSGAHDTHPDGTTLPRFVDRRPGAPNRRW